MCCEHDQKTVDMSAELKRVLIARRQTMERAYREDAARMARLRMKEAEALYLKLRQEQYEQYYRAMTVLTEGRWTTEVKADWVGQDTLPNLVIEQPSKVEAPAPLAKEFVLR